MQGRLSPYCPPMRFVPFSYGLYFDMDYAKYAYNSLHAAGKLFFFFQDKLVRKILSGILLEFQAVWIKVTPGVLLV